MVMVAENTGNALSTNSVVTIWLAAVEAADRQQDVLCDDFRLPDIKVLYPNPKSESEMIMQLL